MKQKYIPEFVQDNLYFYREEKEGYATFISKDYQQAREIIINPTTKEIMGLCDGKKELKEIYDIFQKNYPKVPTKRLKNDVNKTLIYLSHLNIIEWNGHNPFWENYEEKLNKDLSCSFALEEDIREIVEFLEKFGISQKNYKIPEDHIFYLSPYSSGISYDLLAIRNKLFNYSEEFFLLKENKTLVGIISIISSFPFGSSSAKIGLVILNKNHRHIWTRFLQYCLETLIKVIIFKTSKVKFFQLMGQTSQEDIVELFHNIGFIKEGFLKHEIENVKDVTILSYYYKPEFIKKCKKEREEVIKNERVYLSND